MTELKPCPFCGGAGKYHGSYFEDDVCEYVSCTRCNASTPLMDKKGESIEWWNRRANPWHTGTPTEIGNYIAHLRIKSRDGEFIEYDMTCNLEVLLNYIRCQDESEENYLMIKGWMRYEPYKEKEDGHTD